MDDRIENTYLHLHRGTHLRGILNMRTVESKYFFHTNNLYTYSLFRPLLKLKKTKIVTLCKQFNIPYVNDPHNTDMLSCPRNRLRATLSKVTVTDDTFYSSLQKIYTNLEKTLPQDLYPLTQLNASKYRPCDYLVCFPLPASLTETASLLTSLQLYGGIHTKRLSQLTDWFQT